MWTDVTAVALVTGGYWLLDRGLCRGGLADGVGRLGMDPDGWGPLLLASLAAAALGWLVPWSAVPAGESLRVVALWLTGLVSWKAATRDIDVVTGEARWGARALLVLSAGALWLSPGFLVLSLFLLSDRFEGWTHHGTLPLRHLLVVAAFSLVAAPAVSATLGAAGAAAYLFFAVTLHASHYFITALAKGWLGESWYSWVTENRLHHIAASAYSWGWARFVPRDWYRRWLGALRTLDRPFQAVAFAFEALAPLALVSPTALLALAAGWSVFHVMVWVASGILFWEWIAVNVLLGWLAATMPDVALAGAFGWPQLLAGLALMALFPLRQKLWEPRPLAWWDTPLTQRIRWRVRGESGSLYGLYNDFMCPHERLYGRVHGCFLLRIPVFTYHLGEVFRRDLRDDIRACRGDPDEVERLRGEYGIELHDPEMEERHLAYLRRFFRRLNDGARKKVLPRGLRWLKAPGEQLFYWGELPAYRRQEPVERVEILYREEYWDGERFRLVREELLRTVEIEGEPDDGTPEDVSEVRDREVDAMIAERAVGRLIHPPGHDTEDGWELSA